MNQITTRAGARGLMLFFPLAYLLNWCPVLFPKAHGSILPYGPALAALLVLAFTEGRASVAAWWRRITFLGASWRWYLIVPGLLLAIHGVAATLCIWMGA